MAPKGCSTRVASMALVDGRVRPAQLGRQPTESAAAVGTAAIAEASPMNARSAPSVATGNTRPQAAYGFIGMNPLIELGA